MSEPKKRVHQDPIEAATDDVALAPAARFGSGYPEFGVVFGQDCLVPMFLATLASANTWETAC
jgi:hypothetical protein